ncbi:MAG: hypothetical protein Q8P20_02675 [bacterium]|nr:hypothetical protein [bacterium]
MNPDLLLSSPTSKFLPYANVDLNVWKPIYNNEKKLNKKKMFVIAHAPSSRKIKGTQYILKSIERLTHNGYNIKLQLFEKLTHDQIATACQNADLIIDQLLIGWYGGFAVEMMALGKPVICYLDDRISHLVPFYNDIPIINANPQTLYKKIEFFINHPQELAIIGKKSRQFVERIHNPKTIAKTVVRYYQKS